MRKIHLDTDLGGDIDDLCALALLLRTPNLQLSGITTVCENGGARAGYVRHALALEGKSHIPTAAGAEGAEGNYRVLPGLPPEERYWLQAVARVQNPLQAALDLLRQSLEQGASLVAIGPPTNLALLERSCPGILSQAELYLMGGSIYPPRQGFPQWGAAMDWNFQLDVESTKLVLQSACLPTLIPLSVTVETALRRAHLPALRQAGALGELLAHQAERFAEDEPPQWRAEEASLLPRDFINFLHDPLACAIALGWREGVEIQELRLALTIEDGYLMQRPDPAGLPCRVVARVDGEPFSSYWLQQVAGASRAADCGL